MNHSDAADHSTEKKEVESVRSTARDLSSRIYEKIALKGKVTKPGPLVGTCAGRSADKFFTIRHTWSFYDSPVDDMRKAVHRLKEKLPEQGWKITKYGPDDSPGHSLEIFARNEEKEFSVQITLRDRRGQDKGPSMIEVALESACFQTPDGKKVDEY